MSTISDLRSPISDPSPALTLLKGDAACIDLVTFSKGKGIDCIVAPRKLTERQRRVVESLIPRGCEDLPAAVRWDVSFVWADPHWATPETRPEPPFAVRLYFGS